MPLAKIVIFDRIGEEEILVEVDDVEKFITEAVKLLRQAVKNILEKEKNSLTFISVGDVAYELKNILEEKKILVNNIPEITFYLPLHFTRNDLRELTKVLGDELADELLQHNERFEDRLSDDLD